MRTKRHRRSKFTVEQVLRQQLDFWTEYQRKTGSPARKAVAAKRITRLRAQMSGRHENDGYFGYHHKVGGWPGYNLGPYG